MINGLASLGTFVDDEAISIAIDLAFIGDLVGDLKHSEQHRPMTGSQVVNRRDVLLWNYQDVGRRHRPDVLEGDDLLVAEDLLRWNLAGKDLAEKAVVGHRPSLPAEKTVGARRQGTNGRERPQPLVPLRGAHRDVVVAQPAHLLR
jgi:hypothetical protein